MLGRVAYQSGVGEIVLWGALATHVIAGATKRIITRFTLLGLPTLADHAAAEAENVAEKVAEETAPPAAKPKLTVAQLSGYILAPFAIHHAFANRILPSSPQPPISGLSPSELDYSFVSHTLSHPNLPVRLAMATAYSILIGAFAVHIVYAVPTLLRSLPKRSSSSRKVGKAKRSQAQISASLAAVLLASLAAIVPLRSSDRLTISSALKSRYDAVLRVAFPTRYFFS